jgi:LCP family protein required for cell wall assembly
MAVTPPNNGSVHGGSSVRTAGRTAPTTTGRIYRSAQTPEPGGPTAAAQSTGRPPGGGRPPSGGGRRAARGGHGGRGKGRTRRVLLIVGAVLLILLGIAGVGGYTLVNKVSGNVGRIDNAFGGLNEQLRPTKPEAAKQSQTFLLLGSDSRDNQATTGSGAKSQAWKPGEQRTDTIMVVHIPADHGSAQIVSIPRDSWVDIPGKGKMKVNAAYSLGGPSLLIQTFENLTQVRIDHFAVVDFAGFKSIIDAIGGIDVEVSQDTTDPFGDHFRRGVNHLNGTQALGYVRQRYGLEAGDLDRVKRQQNLLRSVMTKLGTFDPASDPVGSFRLLNAFTKSISVDDTLTDSAMRSLAFDVPHIRGGGVAFMTAPTNGTGMEGDQSVVYLNPAQSGELWNAMRNDTMAAYTATHSKDLLPAVTR